MAHLLHIYKGSTEFIWNNFDETFIDKLLRETSKINKAEQDYIEGKTTSSTNTPHNPKTQGVRNDKLEDIEPTEEELNRFREHLRKKGLKYEES